MVSRFVMPSLKMAEKHEALMVDCLSDIHQKTEKNLVTDYVLEDMTFQF